MADDLQRFLDRRPILARRPTPAERLRAWSRRHPSIVGVGVVALILLSAASMVSTALVRREQAKTLAEQRKAESAYRRERQRAEEAEARFRLARRSVDELIRVSEEELAHRPGMEGLRKRLLASALAYYQEFIEQRRSDPAAQAELRDTTRRVETILADLAVLRAAGELYLLAQPSAHDDLRLDEGQRAKVADLSDRAGRRWIEAFGDPAHPPPAGRACAAGPGAGPRQRGGGRRDPDALSARPAPPDRPPVGGAGRLPRAGGRGGASGSRPASASGSARSRRRSSSARCARCNPAKPPEDAGKPAMERILAVLAADQARRWKEMAGEPILGPLSPSPAAVPAATRPEADDPLIARLDVARRADRGPAEKISRRRTTRALGPHLYL